MLEALARHLPRTFVGAVRKAACSFGSKGRGFDAESLQRRVIERGVAFVPGNTSHQPDRRRHPA
jgi:hypothetical protein